MRKIIIMLFLLFFVSSNSFAKDECKTQCRNVCTSSGCIGRYQECYQECKRNEILKRLVLVLEKLLNENE